VHPAAGLDLRTQLKILQYQQALATSPFGNTCEANAVSPKAAKRGVAGHRCLQPGEYQVELIQQ
jgi:hypothetical protein